MATTKKLMLPKLKIASVGAGFALLLLCAVVSARWGWANALQNNASEELRLWNTQYATLGQYPSKQTWEALRDLLNDADQLDPHNVYVIDTLGQLYLHRYQQQPDLRADDEKALQYFHQAAMLRPASPFTWTNIVAAKYRVGQVDGEFYLAMRQAMNLGPWEPDVQLMVVDKGFALWDEMPVSLRLPVQQMAENATRRYPAEMLYLAQNRGRLDLICAFEKLAAEPRCKPYLNVRS